MMPSDSKHKKADLRIVGDVYLGSDINVHDDDGERNDILFDIQCAGLPSKTRKKSAKKKINKKGVSVATEVGAATERRRSVRRPVDLMCSQFPTDANSTVGVDVSCGAMTAFSKEVPYNSAGISLVSPMDTNPAGFLSQNTRRRRRPTRISSMPSSPPNNDIITVQRRLRASDVNPPTKTKRRTFRVERFNYAKALLRSDHELEKLSRKIRSEINESELFELAEAAEKAADLGVENFSGRASTFDGELHRQRQEEFAKTTKGLPATGNRKQMIGDYTTTHYSLAKIPRSSRAEPREIKRSDNKGKEIDVDVHNASGISEQSLLDHARAAAAAVVVAKQAVQLQASAVEQIRKEPERRSMGIDYLRDVNEVIPLWKELHGHMRTHFYRANVEKNYLFFCEPESLSTPSNKFSARKHLLPSSSIETKENEKETNHQRKKSFFDNLAGMKLLPNFRPKESPQSETVNIQPYDDIKESIPSKTSEFDIPQTGDFGTTLSSHISPRNEDFGKVQPLGLCVPPGLVHPDECKNYNIDSFSQGTVLKLRKGVERQDQSTSLTPRLPKRSESFDLEVLQITGDMPASHGRPSDDQSSSESDDGDDDQDNAIQSAKNSAISPPFEYEHRYTDAESTASSPKGKRESSISSQNYALLCPVSPSKNSTLCQSSPRFVEHSSPNAPSTPNSSVIPRRKDSGFSTPAHLRIIKRLHSTSVSDENGCSSNDCLEDSKPQNSQDVGLQDEVYASTPATGPYAQFEPNSIIQNSSGRSPQILTVSPSLQYTGPTHLALPTIQSLKSENERQNVSRSIGRRKVRTQRKSGSVSESPMTPTASVSNLSFNKSEDKLDDNEEEKSSVTAKQDPFCDSKKDGASNDDSKLLSSSKIISYIDPAHDTRALQKPQGKSLHSKIEANISQNSIRKIQYVEALDEKKECDSTSSLNLNSFEKEKSEQANIGHHQYVLSLSPMPNEDQSKGNIRTKQSSSPDIEDENPSSQEKSNFVLECSPLHKHEFTSNLRKRIEKSKTRSSDKAPVANSVAIETIDLINNAETKDFVSSHSIHKDDESNQANVDNSSVCHSLPPTEASFKAAVQTVQGVAVQTVQEVISHLSIGSPRNVLQSNEWQSEGENREFLSNYFYCAKSIKGNSLLRSAAENFDTETDFEGLDCAEPCNVRDLPCHLFGIDTMCGGLIDLLPHDADVDSALRNERRKGSNSVLSHTPTRDRSSSISMNQMKKNRRHSHSGANCYKERDEGTWLGMFQKVASEQLNLQFQTEENELETSRHHPYTPPCLSRKLPNPNQTQ